MTECPAVKYDLKNNFYIKDELVEITCFCQNYYHIKIHVCSITSYVVT